VDFAAYQEAYARGQPPPDGDGSNYDNYVQLCQGLFINVLGMTKVWAPEGAQSSAGFTFGPSSPESGTLERSQEPKDLPKAPNLDLLKEQPQTTTVPSEQQGGDSGQNVATQALVKVGDALERLTDMQERKTNQVDSKDPQTFASTMGQGKAVPVTLILSPMGKPRQDLPMMRAGETSVFRQAAEQATARLYSNTVKHADGNIETRVKVVLEESQLVANLVYLRWLNVPQREKANHTFAYWARTLCTPDELKDLLSPSLDDQERALFTNRCYTVWYAAMHEVMKGFHTKGLSFVKRAEVQRLKPMGVGDEKDLLDTFNLSADAEVEEQTFRMLFFWTLVYEYDNGESHQNQVKKLVEESQVWGEARKAGLQEANSTAPSQIMMQFCKTAKWVNSRRLSKMTWEDIAKNWVKQVMEPEMKFFKDAEKPAFYDQVRAQYDSHGFINGDAPYNWQQEPFLRFVDVFNGISDQFRSANMGLVTKTVKEEQAKIETKAKEKAQAKASQAKKKDSPRRTTVLYAPATIAT